jgi:cell division inhibitor SepF
MEVCVIKPTSIEDAKEITDTLLEGKAVVLNLDGIESKVAQRLIDFAAGSSYAIDGNLQMITSTMIIITPPNVNVTGDLSDIVNKDINLSTIEDTTLTAHSLDF